MAIPHPTDEERFALCEWLTANGVDVGTVPRDSEFTITQEPDGARVIRYTEFVCDQATGNILADPEDHSAMRQDATTPCIVEPPAWLNVPRSRHE